MCQSLLDTVPLRVEPIPQIALLAQSLALVKVPAVGVNRLTDPRLIFVEEDRALPAAAVRLVQLGAVEGVVAAEEDLLGAARELR